MLDGNLSHVYSDLVPAPLSVEVTAKRHFPAAIHRWHRITVLTVRLRARHSDEAAKEEPTVTRAAGS